MYGIGSYNNMSGLNSIAKIVYKFSFRFGYLTFCISIVRSNLIDLTLENNSECQKCIFRLKNESFCGGSEPPIILM